MPLESWYAILQWAAAILVGATFVVGVGTVWVGDKVNKRQSERVAGLEKATADARLKQEELKQQNLVTERRLVEEQVARAELEKALSPRIIPLIRTREGETNLDPLKHFAGQSVIVQFLPEPEARRAAGEVANALKQSGWNILDEKPNPELESRFWDGVVVEESCPKHIPPPLTLNDEFMREIGQRMKDSARLNEVANAVTNFLSSNDWAVRQNACTSEIPLHSIRVSIGIKPPPVKGRIMKRLDEAFLGPTPPIPDLRVNARHLTTAQQEFFIKTLADELSPFRLLASPVEIRCPAENAEACAFADEIAEVLRRSKGWSVKGGSVIRDAEFPRVLTGVVIVDQWSEEQFYPSFAVLDALQGAGFEARRESRHATRYDPMQILVGW